LSLEPASALFVIRNLLRMLAAINLDDQSALETDKIHDEGSKGLLTSELHASNLMTLEDSPKVLFCVRQVLA
jgi:hypothetical protein